MDRRNGIHAALGYVFRQPAWLDEALTHKSFLNEQRLKSGRHNERLELLGDAVLALVITDYLTERFPQLDEGQLSKLKARLVSAQVIAKVAQRLELGRFLRLGRGEEATQGREKPSVLADAFEAVLAAIYRDGGLDEARAFALRVLEAELLALDQTGGRPVQEDFKTRLQEYCQSRIDMLPQYNVTAESGPDHRKVFEVELTIDGRVCGMGRGHTKKAAEQAAAREALERLGGEAGTPTLD
jgi:ribonuclease-3